MRKRNIKRKKYSKKRIVKKRVNWSKESVEEIEQITSSIGIIKSLNERQKQLILDTTAYDTNKSQMTLQERSVEVSRISHEAIDIHNAHKKHENMWKNSIPSDSEREILHSQRNRLPLCSKWSNGGKTNLTPSILSMGKRRIDYINDEGKRIVNQVVLDDLELLYPNKVIKSIYDVIMECKEVEGKLELVQTNTYKIISIQD